MERMTARKPAEPLKFFNPPTHVGGFFVNQPQTAIGLLDRRESVGHD